jgi:hypothetical protein
MYRRLSSVLASAAVLCVCSASDCGVTTPANNDFDPSQREEVWSFVTDDPRGGQMHAKVLLKGCTQSQCTGATFSSVTPYEWGTPFGTCTLRWHISGQVTGDLVSFTLNANDCETTIQGRSGSGGRLNGKFGTATGTTGSSTMSWNGFTTLFSSDGSLKPFEGSGYWLAYRCAGAVVPCPFPVP